MKFIKKHMMFIIPLMAILLGVEFYLVFDRTTSSYEKGLKEGYSMLVVTKKPMKLSAFKELNQHIRSSEPLKRENIVSEIAQGIDKNATEEILSALPYFYSIRLNTYLELPKIEKIKKDLERDKNVKKVETFGDSYSSSYKLFSFIQLSLNISIVFIAMVSLLLIVKQMEIWKYAHTQRMHVMEIFGAPLMMRSGILFRVAIVDAIISTIIMSLFFFYFKFKWVDNSGIEMMIQNKENLFRLSDIAILLGSSLLIVILAVYWVVFTTKGVRE